MSATPWTSRFGLPLLTRELLEQSARKRTYVLRTLYASLLFAGSFLLFHQELRITRASPLAVLGHGKGMFDVVIGLQFAGIYLFMPAIMSGVITQEKERNSLMLLFLTRLGPWTIVCEKLLSRLIPMLWFLLLSLPLLAFTYSLGGISPDYLWSGVWMLAVAALQAGTIALACSAWCRTTASAFVSSYLVGVLLFVGPLMVLMAVTAGRPHRSTVVGALVTVGLYESYDQGQMPLFPPMQFFENRGIGQNLFWKNVLRSIPILLQSALCLAFARWCLFRRAFLVPRSFVLNVFRWLDRQFTRWNENRLTRGVVLIGEKASLPDENPVSWREVMKRSLGQGRYLVRILLILELPIAALCSLIATLSDDVDLDAAKVVLGGLWILAALIIAVQSASLIATERSRQTLDVLCTTPLSGRAILLQKFQGVRRVMAVLLVPFGTILLLALWWRTNWGGFESRYYGRAFSVPLYATCAALSLAIYLPLIGWFSLWMGLIARTQARAIIAAVGGLTAWCFLPILLIILPLEMMRTGSQIQDVQMICALLSPMMIIAFNEENFRSTAMFDRLPWLAVILNFLWYGGALFAIRHVCLNRADRWLGRTEPIFGEGAFR